MPLAVSFYEVVLVIHIVAAVAAFGLVFIAPLVAAWTRRADPRAVPAVHRALVLAVQRVLQPAATLVLLAGLFLVIDSDAWEFKQAWVSVGLVVIATLLGLAGAVFIPRERRAAEIAERDLATGDGTLSTEYDALARRLANLWALAGLLVLVAVFVMVTKPGV